MAAEYIAKEGNERVILCERGIKTFERSTRFTLDLSAVPGARSARRTCPCSSIRRTPRGEAISCSRSRARPWPSARTA